MLNIFLNAFVPISDAAIQMVNVKCVFYEFCSLAYVFIFNSYLIPDLLVVIHKCVIFVCLG